MSSRLSDRALALGCSRWRASSYRAPTGLGPLQLFIESLFIPVAENRIAPRLLLNLFWGSASKDTFVFRWINLGRYSLYPHGCVAPSCVAPESKLPHCRLRPSSTLRVPLHYRRKEELFCSTARLTADKSSLLPLKTRICKVNVAFLEYNFSLFELATSECSFS